MILVEGILLLAVPEICKMFDLTIFIDTDDDVRFLRRLEPSLPGHFITRLSITN